MSVFFERFVRHFDTAWKSIRRHLAMSISSAAAVSVTLILMALFLVIASNVGGFTANVETNLKIHVSIDSLADQEQIDNLQNEIEQLSGVLNVDFSSKEEELDILIEESGSVFERYKDKNPMPNVFVVEATEATLIQPLCEEISALDGIDQAQYGDGSIQNMIDTFMAIRIGGIVFIVALMLIAVFLIANTIKMTIQTRQRELSIMRNVGATNWYIRTPFMMEGTCIGMFGSVVPIAFTILGYAIFYHMMDGYFISNMFALKEVFPFVLWVSLLLLFSGALVGLLGSFYAVSKYLRYTR